MLRRGLLAGLLAVAAASTPALAVTGKVTDLDGRPLDGARVCLFQRSTNVEQYCVTTEADGRFELPDSLHLSLRVLADGYGMELVPASGHQEVALPMATSLTVRLVDASSGSPIDEGEVYVIYPSAKRKGPFPANRVGVRVNRVLEPGKVRLVGRAAGYAPSLPLALELERGKPTEATLELSPLDEAASGKP